jgi:hypothetical protein
VANSFLIIGARKDGSQTMRLISLGLTAACLAVGPASADELKIVSISVSKLSKANLCDALGGGGQPPSITIRHSKGTGSISVSMADHLSDGRTVDHGSTSISADSSGTTHVNYSFRAPCNKRTAQGLRSAYYVTATSGGSTKTVLWSRYP